MRSNLVKTCVAMAILCSLPLAAPAADPAKPEKASGKASDKAANKAASPLQPAIEALTQEFEAVLKDPATATTRLESDYFNASKEAPTVSQADLLALLGKRLHKDPRADAFIKWQLLSVQKAPFDEAAAKEALRLYQRPAHRLPPRLGTGSAEQSKLNSQIARLRPDDATDANSQWQQALDQQMVQFGPMLGYREALYTRLPRTGELFGAALQDIADRVKQGWSVGPFMANVLADIRGTAAGLKANEIRQLGSMVQKLGTLEPPKAYTGVTTKNNKVEWSSSAVGFDKRAIKETVDALETMARSPL